MTKIKAGYCLEITTWENDGDNYNTTRKDGLSYDHTKFYLEIAELFRSCNNWKGPKGFGNSEEDPDDDVIREIVQRYVDEGKSIPDAFNPETWGTDMTIEDAEFRDSLWDVIETTEYGYWRVFERASVYFFQDDVVDIIDKFK